MRRAVSGLVHAAGRAGVHHVRVVWIHRQRDDVMDFFHPVHALLPQSTAILGAEDTDGRGDVDEVGIGRVEHELIDDRDVLLEAGVVRSPALAAVRALVHGVPHGAGQDVRRAVGVHPQGEDAKAAQVRGHFAPGGSAVAGLVQRFVGGHVEDVRVPGMRRDHHDRVTLLSTGRDRKQESAQHPGAEREGH